MGLQDRLSKGDMEFLMMNTRYDEKTIQEWHRGFMSDCPDGRMDRDKMKVMFKALMPQVKYLLYGMDMTNIINKLGLS